MTRKLRKSQNGRTAIVGCTPFYLGKSLLEESGYRVISAKEQVGLILKGELGVLVSGGNFVREGFIHVPNKGTFDMGVSGIVSNPFNRNPREDPFATQIYFRDIGLQGHFPINSTIMGLNEIRLQDRVLLKSSSGNTLDEFVQSSGRFSERTPEQELAHAIETENFELAARLRDENIYKGMSDVVATQKLNFNGGQK